MTSSESLAKLRRGLAAQADYRCRYCQTSERLTGISLTLDHIIPRVMGGDDKESNLCVACRPCNEFKAAQTHAYDPISNENVPLFNPRAQSWREHFEWGRDGLQIIGKTATGRATVEALKLNRDIIVYARRRWVKVGWHPPE